MKTFFVFFLVMTFFGCQKTEKSSYVNKSSLKKAAEHPGQKAMKMLCYACHNPATPPENSIAPTMIAVKNHYYKKSMGKEDFVEKIQNWISNPTLENSKIPGAVKRFGLMPKQYFSKKSIQEISEYIFENDLETPSEFQGTLHKKTVIINQKKTQENSETSLSIQAKALQIISATKAVLGRNLMGKIQQKGTIAALEFCNENAISLTDSMSIKNMAVVKRLTDKPRNPKNKANIEERNYIQLFKENIKNNKDVELIVVENSQTVSVYYPIITNNMCLQCHGRTQQEISKKTLASIKKLYPNDEALGYNINEVRGIWNITFKK